MFKNDSSNLSLSSFHSHFVSLSISRLKPLFSISALYYARWLVFNITWFYLYVSSRLFFFYIVKTTFLNWHFPVFNFVCTVPTLWIGVWFNSISNEPKLRSLDSCYRWTFGRGFSFLRQQIEQSLEMLSYPLTFGLPMRDTTKSGACKWFPYKSKLTLSLLMELSKTYALE